MAILITGASSGIGLALAQHYCGQGEKVYACGRNLEKLEQAFARESNVIPLCFDITEKSQVLQVAEGLEDIQTLILNAGDCEYFESVVPFDSAKFERMIKVNTISLAYCLEAFLHKLPSGGQLVFVSSSAHLVPFPKAQGYGASKAACSYLAQSLAVDLVSHGIDVTLVEPGFVKTPLTAKNAFSMPFLVTAHQAANIIASGIAKRKSIIRFPTALMASLHILSQLPVKWLANILNRK